MIDDDETAPVRIVLDEPEGEDALLTMLREGQLLLLRHPAAAQAALRALVAEGRAFAATPAGRRWKARLADSELVRRGRMLWQGSVLTMLEERSDTLLPSALLDAVLGAAASDDLGGLLARLLHDDPEDDGGTDAP
jgi:hypothetical protein